MVVLLHFQEVVRRKADDLLKLVLDEFRVTRKDVFDFGTLFKIGQYSTFCRLFDSHQQLVKESAKVNFSDQDL